LFQELYELILKSNNLLKDSNLSFNSFLIYDLSKNTSDLIDSLCNIAYIADSLELKHVEWPVIPVDDPNRSLN